MSEFDATGGRRSVLGPIRPSGLGYRTVSTLFLVMALLAGIVGLLGMLSTRNEAVFFFFLWLVGWLLVLGVLLRIVSDFLAALADIARAVREGR